ncbi:MAG: hypothetical protein GY906_39840, partial [bacterium]|nr:hypothetical protein [bacterium]
MLKMFDRAMFYVVLIGTVACGGTQSATVPAAEPPSEESGRATVVVGADDRFELPIPGPMLPPVPAIVLGVKGLEEKPDELSVVWTFVLNGHPPQVGISVEGGNSLDGPRHAALDLIEHHGEFTLNVPDASWIESFDGIDMTSSTRDDKFVANNLTRLPSKTINAPGIAEAAIVLECRVLQQHVLPPSRTVFLAEVLRTSTHPGVTDAAGRLDSNARQFFGMTSGNGEFWT